MTIDGGPVVEEGSMFERGTYVSVLYCLCFVNEKPVDMLEEKVLK